METVLKVSIFLLIFQNYCQFANINCCFDFNKMFYYRKQEYIQKPVTFCDHCFTGELDKKLFKFHNKKRNGLNLDRKKFSSNSL